MRNKVGVPLKKSCAGTDNAINRAYVGTLFSGKVRRKIESTADELSYQTIVPNKELVREIMEHGNAWSASVQVEPGELILQYFSNQACVKGVRLSYVQSRWVIHELSEACD
jgi:hypothetical protein